MTIYNIPSGIKSDSTSMILKEIDRTSVSMLYSNIPIHFLAPLFALNPQKEIKDLITLTKRALGRLWIFSRTPCTIDLFKLFCGWSLKSLSVMLFNELHHTHQHIYQM